MKTKSITMALFSGVAIAVIALAFPGRGEGQQSGEKADRQAKVIDQLRHVEVASKFYDNLLSKETDWELVEFHPPHPIDKYFKVVKLELKTKKTSADVLIYEYPTVAEANDSGLLHSPLNAEVERYTAYGEQGQKIYGPGGFAHLGYRSGRFIVYITTEDERAADRLAAYAFETVSQYK